MGFFLEPAMLGKSYDQSHFTFHNHSKLFTIQQFIWISKLMPIYRSVDLLSFVNFTFVQVFIKSQLSNFTCTLL